VPEGRFFNNDEWHEEPAFSHVAFPEGLVIPASKIVRIYLGFEYTGRDINEKCCWRCNGNLYLITDILVDPENYDTTSFEP
jgi:hypothetical protein